MNYTYTLKSILIMAFLLIVGNANSIFAQCNCGTGVDGAYSPTSSTTLVGGTYNFSSFTIPSGVTISVTGNNPLIIYSTGAVFIAGILDASGGNGSDGITYTSGGTGGVGVAGGQNGGGGSFATGSGPYDGTSGNGAGAGFNGTGWSGGGGAGYATIGASASVTNGLGGPSYGDTLLTGATAGSGGGGGSGGYDCGAGGGGAGGGYISFYGCGDIVISASGIIKVNGGNGGSDGTGNCGGGGGGSAGSIFLSSFNIVNDGSLQANAGIGGASAVSGNPYYGTGGNGSDGRIRIDGALTGSGSINPSVGSAGTFAPLIATITPSTSQAICDGNTALFTASAGTGYQWYLNGNAIPLATNATYPASDAGVYNVIVTNASGCTDSADAGVNLEVYALPVVSITTPSTEVCAGSSTILSSSAGAAYEWYFNGNPISGAINNTYSASQAGSYNVLVTNANACNDTASVPVVISVNDLPTVSISNNTTSICELAAAITLTGSPAGGTFSGNGVQGNSFNPASAGVGTHAITYSFTDANGCTNTASSSISVFGCLGMDENIFQNVQIYPNPSSNVIYVKGLQNIPAYITVTDVTGKVVLNSNYQTNTDVLQINVNTISDGLYYLNIRQESTQSSFPIIIGK